MTCKAPLIAASAFAMLLAGCASSGDKYPSLVIRDVERVQGSFTPGDVAGPAAPPTRPSADLLARLVQLREEAEAAHADFMQAAPRASRLVGSAQSAAIASNRWADAQVALSDLESLRSRTAIALGEMDVLYVDAATRYEPDQRIGEVRAAIISLVADEDVTLAALRGQLRS